MSNRKQKATRTRRQFTVDQKVALLRRHLVDKTPVSELCNEEGLQPSVFYQWLRQVHDNLGGALVAAAPVPEPSKRERELAAKVAHLEERLAKKDGVIAEISAEYVQLKKELGEP
jgi:transposase-like protein